MDDINSINSMNFIIYDGQYDERHNQSGEITIIIYIYINPRN